MCLPERYKDDAIDDVELVQDGGHAGCSELENQRGGRGERKKKKAISTEHLDIISWKHKKTK